MIKQEKIKIVQVLNRKKPKNSQEYWIVGSDVNGVFHEGWESEFEFLRKGVYKLNEQPIYK